MSRRFIINADDFGLTQGVNRAIAELHGANAVSSATLMATGLAFDHAVEIATTHPTLAVGCHLVLTGGLPISDPTRVPSLVQSDGRFRRTLRQLLIDVYRGRVADAEIEIEALAQIRRLQNAGIAVSHVDTHKHTHLFPRIARPLMRAAAACGVRAIRNPLEPAWSARLSRGRLTRSLESIAVGRLSREFHRLCCGYDLRSNDGCIGISSTATLDAKSLQAVLQCLPDGVFELICHPGYNDADLAATGSRLRATRAVERRALREQIPPAVQSGQLQLLNFRDV